MRKPTDENHVLPRLSGEAFLLVGSSLYNVIYKIYIDHMSYVKRPTSEPVDRRDGGTGRQKEEGAMFEDKTRVLLVVPREVVDRARVYAGAATTKLKRPVSLQMVLRALIDEGLKRDGDRAILANVEEQVQAILRIRSEIARARGPGKSLRNPIDAAQRVRRRASQARRS